MDQSNNVHLRWNKHQTTLVSVFDTLLDNEKLTDCTISAEGRHLRAHKIILSACSPYFEELLTENYEKHPIIILHDVKYNVVKALVDFMYRGEVDVLQEELSDVLKLSESLQVRGLSGSGCVDNVSMQKGRGRNTSTIPPETLPFQPASVSSLTSGQNEAEANRQPDRGVSPTVSTQGGSSIKTGSTFKPIQNYTTSINQSGSEQGTGQNAFEEAITRDIDSLHQYPSQRQALPPTCKSAGGLVYSPIRALKTLLSGTHTTVSVSPYNPNHHHSVCSELSSSGGVACSDTERNSMPQVVSPDKISANLSAPKQEVPLETKSEMFESSMEIVEDRTVDDDDYYTGDDDYREDCNIVEVGTGEVKRVNEGSEEIFHMQGSNIQQSSFSSDYMSNMTLTASQTVLNNRYSCQTCGNSYRYHSGLSRHKNQCGNKELQFQCPHCSFRCGRSDNLKAHIIRHVLRQQK